MVIVAASAAQGDVIAAYASASRGDTVQIPAGVVTWDRVLVATPGVETIVAGEGLTIIHLAREQSASHQGGGGS